jgi:sugar lactone lactonase YvrE
MRLPAFFLGFALTIILLWAMWPAPITPALWDEPEPPEMTGVLEPLGALARAEIFDQDQVFSGEGLAIGPGGEIFAGTPSGYIQRLTREIDSGQWHVETLAQIPNTPMIGLQLVDETTLGIASNSGLYALDINTLEIQSLSTGVASHPFGFVNDLDVSNDGQIYFTDSSRRWGHRSDSPGYYLDMLENRPNGMVYVWDPQTRATRVAIDQLYYPNGIAVASDGQSIFISETFRYRIQQFWIGGPRAGQIETFADNLPGMPDGLTTDGQGRLYIAMLSQRSSLLAAVHRNRALNLLLSKLPNWLRPNGGPTSGFIAVMDEASGEVLDSFHDPNSSLNYISSVIVAPDGHVWFGSVYASYLARFELPTALVGPTRPVTENADEMMIAQDP